MGLKLTTEGNRISGNSRAIQSGIHCPLKQQSPSCSPSYDSNPKIQAQTIPKKPCLMLQCQIKVLHGYRTGEFSGERCWLLEWRPSRSFSSHCGRAAADTEVPKLFGSLPEEKELLQGSSAASSLEGLSRWPSTAWQSPAFPATQSQEVPPHCRNKLKKKRNKKGETAVPMRWEINKLTWRSRMKKWLYPDPCCSRGRIQLAKCWILESFLWKMSKSEPRAPSAGAPSAAEQLHGAGGGLWACSFFLSGLER